MRNRSNFHIVLGKYIVGMSQFLPQRKKLLNKIEQNVTQRFSEVVFGANFRLIVAKPGIIARADKLIIYNI